MNVLTTFRLRAVVVVDVDVVVDVVNERLGCETLPGLWSRTNATAPPARTSSTTPTISPHRSQRRAPGPVPGLMSAPDASYCEAPRRPLGWVSAAGARLIGVNNARTRDRR